jgi:FkbM family methyltransferase
MLNLTLGEEIEIAGAKAIRSRAGAEGHILYGPYQELEPGRYVVAFAIACMDEFSFDGDRACAVLDVAAKGGCMTHARQTLTIRALGREPQLFPLAFDVFERETFEFRILNLGEVRLEVLERRELMRFDLPLPRRCKSSRYPTLDNGPVPTPLLENPAGYRALYERGADILIEGETLLVQYGQHRANATHGDLDSVARELWPHGLAIDVSYADASEDVILLNALRDVSRDEGFYIDVGANDPETISVTKLFYDRGWRGINVEPSPKWFARLAAERPRDTNLQLAVSDQLGSVAFFDHVEGGLGTMERAYADLHREERGTATHEIVVETATLADICAQHAPRNIHFLKVDVEGHEAAALRSMDFNRFRPWLLCIEATEPMNVMVKTFHHWDGLVTNAGYLLARSDHLNRYYVAAERSHLLPRFAEMPRGYVRA